MTEQRRAIWRYLYGRFPTPLEEAEIDVRSLQSRYQAWEALKRTNFYKTKVRRFDKLGWPK